MVLIRDHPSPNHDQRPEGQAVDILIIHYTGMKSAQEALDKLCDETGEARVSAHYLIDEDGVGKLDGRRFGPDFVVPQWVLFSW